MLPAHGLGEEHKQNQKMLPDALAHVVFFFFPQFLKG